MYTFSTKSLSRLSTVHPKLQEVMTEAIKHSPIDFGIPPYGGKRTAEEQAKLHKDGLSTLDGVNRKSRHQSGEAVDVFAYVCGKASWDHRHIRFLAGHILGTANRIGVDLRWGGDWDGDNDYSDQSFNDLVHFELR
jgi:peptidoglycan L-alanyl-D-glutamate endopeptidase CwlK